MYLESGMFVMNEIFGSKILLEVDIYTSRLIAKHHDISA